jgi:ELWxxDGT repeat protein
MRRIWCYVFLVALAGPRLLEAGTAVMITDDSGQPVLYPSYITEFNGLLYFRGSNPPDGSDAELWSSDGSVATRAADVNPGPTGSSPSYLASFNNRLYFGATGATGGVRLYEYSQALGAQPAPGSASQAGNPQSLITFGGNLYFSAFRSNIGIELWKFDGVNQTPIDMFPGSGSSLPQHFAVFQNQLYFGANGTAGQGAELWRYSGSGTPAEAARINPGSGSSPEHLVVFDGSLYFSAMDSTHGRELWRYNGSSATLAADIVPGGQFSSSNPTGLTVFGNKLYFAADDGVHGYELWSFDGMTAAMVSEINPTPNPGNGDTFLMDSNPMDLTVFDGKLYFSANDGVHGRELWSWDGSEARLVLDINPGQYGSEVSELTVYNGRLFFSADDGHDPTLGSLRPKVFALTVPEPSIGLVLAAVIGFIHRRKRA